MSTRTLDRLTCKSCGPVIADRGYCIHCRAFLFTFKPIEGTHVINGRRQAKNNKLRGLRFL